MIKFFKDSYKLLAKYTKNMKLKFFVLGIVTIINIILQLIYPQITKRYIDKAVKGGSSNILILLAVCFLGIVILRVVSDFSLTMLSQKISWETTNKLRLDIVKHTLELDMKHLSGIQKGEMIQKIDGDVDSLFTFFSTLFLSLAISVLTLIGINLILMKVNMIIGIVFIIYTVLAFVIFSYVNDKTTPAWVEMKEKKTEMLSFFGETFDCYDNLSGIDTYSFIKKTFLEMLSKLYPVVKKSALMGYRMWTTSIGIFSVGNIIALSLCGYLWFIKKISVGTVYMIFAYTELLNAPLENLRMQLEDIQVSSASIERIKEMLSQKSEIAYGSINSDVDKPLSVKVKNLSFAYGNTDILKNINFIVEGGSIVGIVGRTGSGKTTIAKLISRLYEYSVGDIFINDYSIKEYSNDFIRNNICFISQKNYFFYGSLKENLTVFKSNVKDEEIISAIKLVGMYEWYKTLQAGLDTKINPNQIELSQGEIQLLALSRAFIKNPKLLILDEISSKLDPCTESKILNSISLMKDKMTCIIITHRKKTLSIVNSLIMVEDGTIIKAENIENNNSSDIFDDELINIFDKEESIC